LSERCIDDSEFQPGKQHTHNANTLGKTMENIHCEESSLGHLPQTERWEFDESVTKVFPDMLRRSIPQYEVMRQAVFELGKNFVQMSTNIVDLGCSVGDSLAPFVRQFSSNNRYLGIEVSEPMIKVARQKFSREVESGILQIRDLDLRYTYPNVQASLTLCILTLQFIPLEHRQRILKDIYAHTLPGGALIVVEKIVGSSALLHGQFVELYHAYKGLNGYSRQEIEMKRQSLENVLVPLTARWNEDLLRDSGFSDVDVFWRWMNFVGYVAVRR
jgi:tRNA (cmo5U34)-methyltransferase